ncbi:MAG TPA: sulfate ABC transporter permease subunit CysT [bacterium]|jgi:sulfate transport system permease protein|nr:sulfate ABC transporter permease subunit CysT [bacterium]
MAMRRGRNVLPGLGINLGVTLTYLGLLVLIPFAALFLRAAGMGPGAFWAAVSSPRVLAAYRLSFGASFLAAAFDAAAGLVVAWVLVRYEFPGRALLDSFVDLPFALPTAVAGITLTTLFADNGWIGRLAAPLGIKLAYSPLGVTLALVFIGLPFTVRTVQPVIEGMEADMEEASACLGAGRWQTLRWVVFPALFPACLAGFAMAFARALGEYGSVVFISGNIPMRTEIVPLLIMTKLQQYDYAGATAIAVVMLVAAFGVLLTINGIQAWAARSRGLA